jgi:hypothetical protein
LSRKNHSKENIEKVVLFHNVECLEANINKWFKLRLQIIEVIKTF